MSSFLILCNNKNHFSIGLWRVMKSGLYMTTSDDQLSGWTKKLQGTPKAKFAPKKVVMVTVWWSADDLIHCNFLNPSETIIFENYAQQIDEMLWKLQHLQQALLNRKGSVLLHDSSRPHITQPKLQKLNGLGYKVLSHLPYSSDLSSTNSHFFKHLDNFLQGKHFHSQQKAENAFQEFVESWSMDFYSTRNEQIYFSLPKMCWLS